MHQNFFILCLLLLSALSPCAQTYKVQGSVTTTKLEPLSFVSVQVKGYPTGTITKNDGTYEVQLEEGKYDFIISMIGYKTQSFTLVVTKNYVQHIILEEETKSLSEVVVKGRGKDRAEEIIRNVIRNKEATTSAGGAYSSSVYIKAVQQDSGAVAKKRKSYKKDTAASKRENIDLQRMSMTEVVLKLDYHSEGRIKEERLGVKQGGKPEGLFYLSTTEGTFNFYNNLVKVPSLSATPFLSPVSYSGLVAYKYRTLKVEAAGKHKLYTLSVKPKNLSNATVEGEITIHDSAWTILHTRFRFPRYHLPEYDFFEAEQQYILIQNQAWMLDYQQFTYFSKGGKHKLSGQTSVTYKDYELHKNFDKKYFGTELSITAEEAYKKDSSFWQTVRTQPLTQKELRFIRYRDSVYRVTHTEAYLDSMEKVINKVTWKKIAFLGQSIYHRHKEKTVYLPPLLSLYQPFAFGGTRINPSLFYSKTYASKKNISFSANLSYGLRNKDINGSVSISRMYNPFNRGFYRASLNRDFHAIYEGDAWINMIKRSNYYLNNSFSIGHGLELVNGLFLYTDVDVAFRRSVSGYKTGSLADSVLGLSNNQAVYFQPYNAVYGRVRLQYTPKQRYLREPKQKIIIGSAWPTFYTLLRKGIPGFMSSNVSFDYLEAGVEQEIKVGLLGIARYTFKTGSFLSKEDLRLVDYKFQRRGDPLLFMNPDEAFQSLDSTFPLFKQFYQGHFVHEFNGALINKVPLLKKLQLREVGGGGFLIAPERNLRYAETFAGIERVFKSPFDPLGKFKAGVYVVGSVANKFSNPVRFKVGFTSWDKRRNKWQ